LSHLPQRKEKNCLNCGTEVIGKYCHQCGQENIEPKESFWHLITHFFYDFTHFDGKFFSTLKYLVIKPGLLSTEYIKGRRTSYLHPIRMYVFTSAFFFIIFFWMFKIHNVNFRPYPSLAKDTTAWIKVKENALADADNHADSVKIMQQIAKLRSGFNLDSLERQDKNNVSVYLDTISYKTMGAYDSAQNALPEAQRDGWLKRMIRKKEIQIEVDYHGDRNAFWRDAFNNFLHQFPKLFFISLPIFAFFLKMLYVRNKRLYYADHAIFTIHLYIFTFIFFLVLFVVLKLNELAASSVWGWIDFVLWLYWMGYIYKAMRNFYKQRRGKTILKYILLNMAAFIGLIFLFIVFFFYSVLEM
jgi:hypothetical protein